jgi:hypothetical protein
MGGRSRSPAGRRRRAGIVRRRRLLSFARQRGRAAAFARRVERKALNVAVAITRALDGLVDRRKPETSVLLREERPSAPRKALSWLWRPFEVGLKVSEHLFAAPGLSLLLLAFWITLLFPGQSSEFILSYLQEDGDLATRLKRFLINLATLVLFTWLFALYLMEIKKIGESGPRPRELPVELRLAFALPVAAVASVAIPAVWAQKADLGACWSLGPAPADAHGWLDGTYHAAAAAYPALGTVTSWSLWILGILACTAAVHLLLWAMSRRRLGTLAWAGLAVAVFGGTLEPLLRAAGLDGTIQKFLTATRCGAELYQFFYVETPWLWLGIAVMVIALVLMIWVLGRLYYRRRRARQLDAAVTYAAIVFFPVILGFLFWQARDQAVGAGVETRALTLFYEGSDALFALLLFCCVLTVGNGLLTLVGKHRRLPLVAAVVAVGALLSWFDLNSHFEVPGQKATPKPIELGTAFERWLWSRDDIGRYADSAGDAYPVFLVAAQGGGSFAAYHAALTLARLDDRTRGGFSHHTFALSGVSGGALGAMVFHAAATLTDRLYTGRLTDSETALLGSRPKPCQSLRGKTLDESKDAPAGTEGPAERLVRCYFRHDLMTPVVAAGLFNDIPAILWVNGWGGPSSTNRATAYENAVVRAWKRETQGFRPDIQGLLEKPIVNGWAPEDRQPALLINATIVETGRTMMMGPLYWGQPNGSRCGYAPEVGFEPFAKVFPDRDLTRVRAAGLSGRFPILFPAGYMQRLAADLRCLSPDDTNSLRLVDGGYADNSGAETLLSLMESLRRRNKYRQEWLSETKDGQTRTEVKFIVPDPKDDRRSVKVKLVLVGFSHDRIDLMATRRFSELAVPVMTVLNGWGARSAETFLRAERAVSGDVRVYHLSDKSPQSVLPLGLMLSAERLKAIEKRSGFFPEPETYGESADAAGASPEQDTATTEHNNTISETLRCEIDTCKVGATPSADRPPATP